MTPNPLYGENQCANPIFIKHLRMFVNCGKCEYCRKIWINDWATRLQMQKELSYLTICMTLTYNQDNLPKVHGVPTLSKSDIQKFFKRVRRQLDKHYPDVKLQYFISGEYGASFLRPHYHLVLFINTINHTYNIYNFQNICLKEWKKGYIQFMNGNNISIRYLAKYIGKTTGISEYAESNNVEMPFVLMSRRPAIGSAYLDYKDNFELHFNHIDDCHVHLPGMSNVVIPKYIRKKVYEHWPKNKKEKYFEKLEKEKLEKYEKKWLENCRNRDSNNSNSVPNVEWSFPDEQEHRRRTRVAKNREVGYQQNDINYLNNIKSKKL